MARRASSSIHPGALIGGVVVVVVAIVAGKMFLGGSEAAFGDVPRLDVAQLLENGNSLRGNEYAVEGRVDEKLRWLPERGQVVSVRVDGRAGDEFIGIEIPPKFNHLNIEREQRYAFKVKFREGGIAEATDVRRF